MNRPTLSRLLCLLLLGISACGDAAEVTAEKVTEASEAVDLGPLPQASSSFSMEVGEAYRAIPHGRTRFDPDDANLSGDEAVYFDELFRLVDVAMVGRVQTLRWAQSGGARGVAPARYAQEIARVLARLDVLPIPPSFTNAHRLIRGSIDEQRRHIAEWEGQSGVAFQASHPLVQSSHQKLYSAYGQLMRIKKGASSRNKKAFFDYLCALDYI